MWSGIGVTTSADARLVFVDRALLGGSKAFGGLEQIAGTSEMTTHSDSPPSLGVESEFFGHRHVTQIDSRMRTLATDLREAWAYRDLLVMLIQRDVTVRYKQSVVGIAWAVIQPLTMMLIFTVVFGGFAKLPSDGVPYPLFAMAALMPWLYFSRALTGSGDSLVGSAHLVSKVYFPRIILPIGKAISSLVDLAITLGLAAVLLAWYGINPGWKVLTLPLFVLMAMFTSLAVGLWLTALNVRYRDVGLVTPFIIQIWMYVSPIAYSTTIVPETWRWLYALNPIVGVVEGFRWALFGRELPALEPILISYSVVALLFVTGLRYFRRVEQTMVDVV